MQWLLLSPGNIDEERHTPRVAIEAEIVWSRLIKFRRCRKGRRTVVNTGHGLCAGNKLLYKRCARSTNRPFFRPPTAPTFKSDFSETWNRVTLSEKPPDVHKVWLTSANDERVCENHQFWQVF